MPVSKEVQAALDTIFAADSELYQRRGWNRRCGFGVRPALVNIDLANAWTRPGNTFSCADMDDQIIPGVQRLLEAAREKRVPIIYTTTAFCSEFDMGVWPLKAPFNELMLGTKAVEIDERIAPVDGVDTLIVKKGASAFAGTHLGGILRAARIDTLICTGATVSGCVRHTVQDAMCEGFRTIIVRECVGDRVPAAIEWNLFELDMKCCDIESLDRVLAYLERIEPLSQAA